MKTRSGDDYQRPEEAVDGRKMRNLAIAAKCLCQGASGGEGTAVAMFLVGAVAVWSGYELSIQISVLSMKMQEIAMQVSLLNQENERMLNKLSELTGENTRDI